MRLLVTSLFLTLAFGLTGCSKTGKRSDSAIAADRQKKAATAKAAADEKKKADAASAEAQRQQQTQQEEARKKAEADTEAKKKEEADKTAEEQRRAELIAKKAADDKKAAEEAESKKKAEAAAELKKRQEEADKKIAADKAAAEASKAAIELSGKIEVTQDEEKLVKNQTCGIKLVQGEDFSTIELNIGGFAHKLFVRTASVDQKMILGKDFAVKHDGKEYFFVGINPATVTVYKSSYQELETNITRQSRKNYIVVSGPMSKSTDDQAIATYVEENLEKIRHDNNFKDILETWDGLLIHSDKTGNITEFSYSYQEVVNGSGQDRTHPAGDQSMRAIAMMFKNRLEMKCKIEKKTAAK